MQKLANMLEHFSFKPPQLTDRQRREMDEAAEAEEQKRRQREHAERIRSACIPPRYRDAVLADCCGEVRRYAADVLGGSTDWMVLRGKNGRGKTHQAAATIYCVAREKRCRFVTMQQILDECKDTFGRPESVVGVQTRYKTVPFLVIDDFGKEQATDWSLAVIFSIIDGRYNRELPTMFTTNMNSTQLLEHLGYKGEQTMAESVLSRMLDAHHVEVGGEDRRVCKGGGFVG